MDESSNNAAAPRSAFAGARKPWSAPRMILSAEVHDVNKTNPDCGDAHGTSPSTERTGTGS